MWVVGFSNLPYVGQNTNVVIENYHGTLKAQLKSRKNRLVSCRVDWCIHELVKDVFTQYWYQSLCKNFREQQTPTLVYDWGFVGGTIDY
jgi:hypothetical protein